MTVYLPVVISDTMFDQIDIDASGTYLWSAVQSSGLFSTITNNATIVTEQGKGIVVSGQYSTVQNIGEIDAGSFGVKLESEHDRLFNSGKITGAIGGVNLAGNRETVDNVGNITADIGIRIAGNGCVVNNSSIISAPHLGILSTGDQTTIVNLGSIGADGTADSVGTAAVLRGDDAIFVNKGTIGAAVALVASGHDADITNEGYIWGVSPTEALFKLNGTGTTNFVNKGQLDGSKIISGGAGDEVVSNHGRMNGDVRLGGGNDVFDNRGGTVGVVDGGRGNDIYYTGDFQTFTEKSGHGVDTLVSGSNASLGANFENLILTGSDNVDAAGNDVSNMITGNSGDNRLYGGGGDDVFVFSAKGGSDTIADFEDGADRIHFTEVPAAATYDELRSVMTEADGNVVIDLSGYKWGFKVTIEHTTLDQMDRSDFIL